MKGVLEKINSNLDTAGEKISELEQIAVKNYLKQKQIQNVKPC